MSTTSSVIAWIQRMAVKYGGVVYDVGGGNYDWGQALARECYGPDWASKVPDDPTRDDLARALDWERGEWPDWVATKREHE